MGQATILNGPAQNDCRTSDGKERLDKAILALERFPQETFAGAAGHPAGSRDKLQDAKWTPAERRLRKTEILV